MAPGEQARVGAILAAAFADKYGPALGGDMALAAEIAAVLPAGGLCYVGEGPSLHSRSVLGGAGLLRFSGQNGSGAAESLAVWRLLRARQGLAGALRSVVLLSLVGTEHSPDRMTAYLSSLGVDPPWQGQGLGSALLTHLAGVAGAAGKTRLVLHVVDTNTRARRLYERHGFRVVRREPAWFTYRRWGYRALLFMTKTLP